MARGLIQKVTVSATVKSNYPGREDYSLVLELEGTTHKNLRSKIGKWIDQFLISYNVMAGAEVSIKIEAVEPNEFTRPDPE